MSRIIRDMEAAQQRQISSMNQRYQKETRRMNDIHDENRAQLQKAQEADIAEIQHQHHKELEAEGERKDRLLLQMKNNLNQTKDLTDKQLKELEVQSAQKSHEIQNKYSMERERINEDHNLHLEEMNTRFNKSSRKINSEGQDRLEELNHKNAQDYAHSKQSGQKKIEDLQKQQAGRYRNDAENFERLKMQQENQHRKERVMAHQKQEAHISKIGEDGRKQIEKQDQLKRQGLKDQELFFEKRYTENLGKHNDHLKNLDEVHDTAVKKMQADFTKVVEFKEIRAEDPFFQFVELKPTLEHTETGVRIKVKVPDHSKQDLHLGTNGKEIVLNFNRRYVDTQKDSSGNSSRISKIETLTSRVQTGVHLDPKSVKQSFQDGVMTYEIKKA